MPKRARGRRNSQKVKKIYMAKIKKIKVKAEPEIATPLQPVNAEKEGRRAKLLEFQRFCEVERITRLSDIEFKLAELNRQ